MRKRSSKKTIEKGAWMNTYADMVTLLLCFFVLLFAASSIDSEKWTILVRSLNPSAAENSQITTEKMEEGSNSVGASGEALLTDVENFDQLYWAIENYIEKNNLSTDMEVMRGDGYTFIVFRNNVFFDGDKYFLKPGGQRILDFLCSSLTKVEPEIAEMRILGHTNQADPNKRNDIRDDWTLSTARAREVCIYIDQKGILEHKKLLPQGYGQNYPIAPFVNEVDRQKNRRVEILITEDSAVNIAIEEVYRQIDRDTDYFDAPGGTDSPGTE